MIAPLPGNGRRSIVGSFAIVAAMALATFSIACQRVPLLAPSGSSITLTSLATALPLSGTTSIVAQVIEASGNPPHQGTQVTFTTNLGSIQPANIETDINGQAVVTFAAGTQSGTATVSAISGGASVGANGALRIAIGAAAVGRVIVSANPATVSQLGGSTTITANVVDLNGNPLVSAPVNFTTTTGSLSSGFVNSDSNGNARTTLTTSQQATVTASVGAQGTTGAGTGTGTGTTTGTTTGQTSGSVTVAVTAAPTLVITPPSGLVSAGLSALYTFTVSVPASIGTAVRNVTVNWGDGRIQDLGAITGAQSVAHAYDTARTYTITGTLTDALGNVFNVSTAVVVTSRLVPTVSLTTNTSSPLVGVVVTFTGSATAASNSGAVIDNVTMSFGDGNAVSLGSVSGSIQIQHIYAASNTYTATLTAEDSNGGSASAATVLFVGAAPPLAVGLSASASISAATTVETFTATVTGLGNSVVTNYHWEFGDSQSADTTSNTAVHSYATGRGPTVVTVTVTTSTSATASASISITP